METVGVAVTTLGSITKSHVLPDEFFKTQLVLTRPPPKVPETLAIFVVVTPVMTAAYVFVPAPKEEPGVIPNVVTPDGAVTINVP